MPFVGWSRAAHEFRVKAAEMAPGGFLRPLLVGDPGIGKKTMARAWLRVAGRGEGECPVVDLDTWRDLLPDRCIAVTARRPPPERPCFLLESGAWGPAPQRPPEAPTLPADLMQRFAISLYVPPLHGHRDIDILAFLDYWGRTGIRDYGIRYRKIDAALVHRMLFEDDWPANLEGVSRLLRRIGHCDFHRDPKECNIVDNIREIDVLLDRWARLGWSAPPEAEGRRPAASPMAWLWGEEDIPVGSIADVAVRLYTRLARLRLAEVVGREGPDVGPRPMPPPGDSGRPSLDLTAEAFLRLSEEQFARRFLLPGGTGQAGGRPDEIAALLDRLRDHQVLGTDFLALQAGLRIDPVAVNLPSDRTLAFNRINDTGPATRRTQSVGPPAQDPRSVAEAGEQANRFCIEDGIFRIVFRTAEGRTEERTFPREGNLGLAYYRHLIQHPQKGFTAIELVREVGRKDARPEQRHERATAGERYGGETSYDPVLDKEGKRRFAQRRDSIARELQGARRRGDRGRIEELEEEQEFINAELNGAIHIRKEDELDELGRQLHAVDQDLQDAKRDGDPPPVIQELETKREAIVAKVSRIVHGHKDKNLDKSAKRARDRIRKAMADARTKLIRRGLPGLALYLEGAARYKDGSWTYRPSRSSRDWLT